MSKVNIVVMHSHIFFSKTGPHEKAEHSLVIFNFFYKHFCCDMITRTGFVKQLSKFEQIAFGIDMHENIVQGMTAAM